jgi:hypothetical protein
VEAVAHRGTIQFSEVGEPTFLVGLLLQLPFALAAYVVARLLLRAGRVLRRWLEAGRCGQVRRTRRLVPRPVAERPRCPKIPSGYRGRAPPPLVVAG